MIVTVHDYGTIHGGINWSNPRTDDGDVLDTGDFSAEEHETLCQAVIDQVSTWPKRPAGKQTYEFYVRVAV